MRRVRRGKRYIRDLACLAGLSLVLLSCASSQREVSSSPLSSSPPSPQISEETVSLLLHLFSLEPEVREHMYEGADLPFDREKIRSEFFDYVASAPLEENDRQQLFMVLAYIFSDRLLSEREEVIMRDLLTYFHAIGMRFSPRDREQVEKILKVTEARLALDVKDRLRRRR